MRRFLSWFFGTIFLFSLFQIVSAATNLQIEASINPRQACYSSWQNDGCVGSGGISAEDCNSYLTVGNTALRRHIYVCSTSPSCSYFQQHRATEACPPLNQSINLTYDKGSSAGSFTINWSLTGDYQSEDDTPKCTLSGKDPEKGNFSEETNNGSRAYSYATRGIYPFKFSCTGIIDNSQSLQKGTISKTVNVLVGNIPPSPKVTLKVDPVVIKKGESATLSWTSENAISLSIDQGIGGVRPSGSMKISPQATTRYTITGTGEFSELGIARNSITVRVIAPGAPPEAAPIEAPPEATATAPKTTEAPKVDLRVNGQKNITIGAPANFAISWNLNKYCVAYGSWLGIKTKAGQESRTEAKPGTYTYKMYCPTIGYDQAVVRVVGSGSEIALPVAEASVSTDGKNFSQSIRVIQGQATSIWISGAYDINKDKKASRDETGKWTGLMSFGGKCEYNLDLNQGNPTFEGMVADPKTPEACTVNIGNLTFYDNPGVYKYGVFRLTQSNGKISNIGYVNIAVDQPPPPKGPPIIDLRINNLSGPTVTLGAPAEYDLSWNAQNADSCFASEAWDGNKFPSGSQHFVASEKKEFVYTITCTGKLGIAVQSINLKVAELPVCDFSALPLTIDKNSPFNRQSVLSWKCKFSNTCSISPSVGSVDTFGSVRVSPTETTTYGLTCQNLEGSSSFNQAVEVK